MSRGSASSLGSLAALVHEGGESRSKEQSSKGCGYDGDSTPGDSFGDSAQRYFRV